MRLGRVVLFLLVALPALAAQVTDVATGMDEDRPFELDLQATYQHRRDSTRIRRENLQGGAIALVDELQHDRTLDQIDFRVAMGLFRGLELPIVVAPGHSQRSGFRDPSVGLAWAIVDEGREQRLRPELSSSDTAVSTWVVGIDYTLPLPGQVDDPSAFGSAATAGNTITTKAFRRAHVLAAWTAFSKRFSVADPYVLFRASVAIPVKGAFDNCANPAALSEVAPANCANPAWLNEARYQPPVQAGFALGSEFVVSEDLQADRKIAFDVRGDVTWFGAGRDYSQVSDMLGKLTYVQGYVNAVASLGIYGRFASWARLRVYGTLGIDSSHFLTTESVGKDLNGNGTVDVSGGRGIPAPEQNPTYDFRLDQPGHRLRAEDVLTWGVAGTLALSF